MIDFISGVCLTCVLCVTIYLMIQVAVSDKQKQSDLDNWIILFKVLQTMQVDIIELKNFYGMPLSDYKIKIKDTKDN